MVAKLDLTGRRFGRLQIIAEADSQKCGTSRWLCRCDCGQELIATGSKINRGIQRSCGCGRAIAVRARVLTHGQSETVLHRRWRSMRERTRNPNNKHFHRYGGRGIKVCEEWESFEVFARDMGPTFDPSLWLERIDSDGPYSAANCCWATPAQQARNTRRNHRLKFDDKDMIVEDWAKNLGIKAGTIIARLRRGWTTEEALTGRRQ